MGHRGFTATQQQDPGEAKALATTLDADAVLFGELERWDRSYFVVQSHAAVALSLRLVDATGRELCRTHQLATAGSGLSSGPTGYFALATEPLAGLRTAQLQELRRTAARSAVMALAGGELGAAVVATAPRLTLVGVAPHEPEFPLDQPLPPGTRLDLVAVGSPGCIVLCQLGRLRTGITLRETELHHDPRGDRATYQGHYVVQRGDQAADLPVMATIERGVQRRSVRTEYRWRGTLRLGAVPVANR
ncbi:MAG: DUF799 family lipoprotein [Planctomycetes bacterium]|nr:DUF799 family lipoprotein [Planctomycetota bacterium]